MDPKRLGGFELRDVLGEGGMGTVYRAHDPTLDRPAAVKVIRAKALSKEGKERFLREARASSKINHPNMITIYAAGEGDGAPYIAMELIDGKTLREVIDAGGIALGAHARGGRSSRATRAAQVARLHPLGAYLRSTIFLVCENFPATSL